MSNIINLFPINDFLHDEVSIEEFVNMLDQVYFECTQLGLKEPNEFSNETIDALFYIHKFKNVLNDCKPLHTATVTKLKVC